MISVAYHLFLWRMSGLCSNFVANLFPITLIFIITITFSFRPPLIPIFFLNICKISLLALGLFYLFLSLQPFVVGGLLVIFPIYV